MLRNNGLQVLVLAFLLVILVSPAPAQNDDSELWGVWTTIVLDDISTYGVDNMTIGFYPGDRFYLPAFEHLLYGAYTIDNDRIHLLGYAEDPGGNTSQVVISYRYSLRSGTLTLEDLDNTEKLPTSLHRLGGHPKNDSRPCSGAIPSQLEIGYYAQVTYTDGTPTNLRQYPTVNGPLLKTMPEGQDFIVIDGPVCADGYTWWQIWAYDMDLGWAAEGSDEVYFIEPQPNFLHGITSDININWQAVGREAGVNYYPPGRYRFAAQLAEAIVSGEASEDLATLSNLVLGGGLLVKTVDFVAQGTYDIVCTASDLTQLNVIEFNSNVPQSVCFALDTTNFVIAEEPVVGFINVVIQLLANPDLADNMIMQDLNEFFGSLPLTSIFCRIESC